MVCICNPLTASALPTKMAASVFGNLKSKKITDHSGLVLLLAKIIEKKSETGIFTEPMNKSHKVNIINKITSNAVKVLWRIFKNFIIIS